MDPLKIADATTKYKRKIQRKNYIINAIKSRSYNKSFEPIVDYLFGLLTKSKDTYRLIAKQEITDIAVKRVSADIELFQSFVDKADAFSNTHPEDAMSDMASFFIQVLEEMRHKIFGDSIVNALPAEYELVAEEPKLSEHYPTNSNLTPDFLFRKHGRDVLIEVKCRSISGLNMEFYYNRYKDVVGDLADVVVINCNPHDMTVVDIGDLSIKSSMELSDLASIEAITELVKKIRSNYNRFEVFRSYDMSESNVDDEVLDRICFDDIESLPMYDTVRGMFSVEQWDILMSMLKFNYYEADIETVDTYLDDSETKLVDIIKSDKDKFLDLINTQMATGSYKVTDLKDASICLNMDSKNEEKYEKTTKMKPSIYMGLSTSNPEIIPDRTEYYKKIFSMDYNSDSDDYTVAVTRLITDLFCQDFSEVIVDSRNFDYEKYEGINEEYVKMREDRIDSPINRSKLKIMNIKTKTSALNLYMNSVFSWNNTANSKGIITDFKNKKTTDKKPYLSIEENRNNVNKMEQQLHRLNVKSLRNGPIKNIYCEVIGSDNRITDPGPIPKYAEMKFTEHLYTMHKACKNMLSMSMINNTKFRLIQTDDPNNIFIMVPNANVRDKHPVRYINITIMRKKDMELDVESMKELNHNLGLTHTHIENGEYLISISKLISLDIGRLKLLSNSFAEYLILKSYYEEIRKKGMITEDKDSVFCFLACQMITIASLSITENYKNIIMVAYSDYSNLDDLIKDKLNCRPTSMAHLMLAMKLERGIVDAKSQLDLMKASREESFYDDNTKEVKGLGFKDMALKLPITGYDVQTPKEVFHEAFMLFYIGKKGLHGSPQEHLQLYYTSYKFEQEYQQYIEESETVVQEITGDDNYGFSFRTMFYSSLYTYKLLRNSKDRIRSNIKSNLKLDRSPFIHPQFSSTKSCVKHEESETIGESIFDMKDDIELSKFGELLKVQKYDDIDSFCYELNLKIDKANQVRKLKNEKKVMNISLLDTETNEKALLPNVRPVKKGTMDYVEVPGHSFFCPNFESYMSPKSSKVMEEFYKYTEAKGIKTTKHLLESILDLKGYSTWRVFPKNQRTLEDREIYTGNIHGRLMLFPMEMVFKSYNQCIDEEAITTPGDLKHRKMHDQRMDLIKKKRYDKIDTYTSGPLLSVSSDASKWSARDCVVKFIIPILTSPFLLESEKLHLVYCLIKYYKKIVILTDPVMYNSCRLYSENYRNDIYAELTNNFKQNWYSVTSNWLQGNLNNTSSFVHVMTANMLSLMVDNWNNEYNDCIRHKYLVHSDDSAHDFSLLFNKEVHTRPYGKTFTQEEYQGVLLISMLKYVSKKHSITPNEKKTYISRNFKEFLSTMLIGNEIFYFYVSDLLPITSDTSYKSPLDDFSAYSGYINNAFNHLAPYSLIQNAISIINYLSLSTYNLDINSSKNPLRALHEIKGIKTLDLSININPRYKLPMDLGGTLPYYTSDAFRIVEYIIRLKKYSQKYDDEKTIEENLTESDLDDFLKVVNNSWINYIKSCLLTQETSVYMDDLEDPYAQKSDSLCQSSVISMRPNFARNRIPRYESYKAYKLKSDELELKLTTNPQWVLRKPETHEDNRDKLLSNYALMSYINSLSFSSSDIDFARRVMDSNKHIYTLNLPGRSVTKPMTITEIYSELAEAIHEQELTGKRLMEYLGIYLFSNKTHSAIVQTYFGKCVQYRQMHSKKPKMLLSPKSLYDKPEYFLSEEEVMKMVIFDINPVKTPLTHYVKNFIEYIHSMFTTISNSIKMYNDIADIDDDFRDYVQFKHESNKPEDFIVHHPQHKDQVYGGMIGKIKEVYISCLVHNFRVKKANLRGNRMTKNVKNRNLELSEDYKREELINLPGVLLNIQNYMRRSELSQKSILSVNRPRDVQSFWLERFGYYTHKDLYIKYRYDSKVVIQNDSLVLKQDALENYTKGCIVSSCLKENYDFYDELLKPNNIFEIDMVSFLNSCKESKSIFDNTLYHRFSNDIVKDSYMRSKLLASTRILNDWEIPESNSGFSVTYNHGGVYMRFRLQGGEVKKLNVTLFHIGRIGNSVKIILDRFNNDMKFNASLTGAKANNTQYKRSSMKLYWDRFRRLSTVSSYETTYCCSMAVVDLSNLSISIDEDDHHGSVSTLLRFHSNIDRTVVFQFKYKFGRYNSEDLVYQYIESRVYKSKNSGRLIIFLKNMGLVNKYHDKVSQMIFNVEPHYLKFLFPGTAVSKELSRHVKRFKTYARSYSEHCDVESIKHLLGSFSIVGQKQTTIADFQSRVPLIRSEILPSFLSLQKSVYCKEYPYVDLITKISRLNMDWEHSVTLLILLIIRIDYSILQFEFEESDEDDE
nr:putative RNA-dependent RNA polymerase [Perilla mosaic virus]